MDDVAQRVGISKGSLYLHTATRSGLVASLLDRWEADVPPAQDFANAPIEERTTRACEALFHETDRGSGRAVPAFPCCLQTSPCPHSWSERWARISAAHGLSASESEMLGDAVQALAGMGSVRTLLREGNLDEARAIVQRFLIGYVAASPSKP
jgi:AcrR family transcriptional regulator